MTFLFPQILGNAKKTILKIEGLTTKTESDDGMLQFSNYQNIHRQIHIEVCSH